MVIHTLYEYANSCSTNAGAWASGFRLTLFLERLSLRRSLLSETSLFTDYPREGLLGKPHTCSERTFRKSLYQAFHYPHLPDIVEV